MKAGYYGAMASWVDYDLLKALADHPEIQIILIGIEHEYVCLFRSEKFCNKLNNCKSFELGESNINIDLSKDAILVCAWNKQRL